MKVELVLGLFKQGKVDQEGARLLLGLPPIEKKVELTKSAFTHAYADAIKKDFEDRIALPCGTPRLQTLLKMIGLLD